jgi:hypothetical protein
VVAALSKSAGVLGNKDGNKQASGGESRQLVTGALNHSSLAQAHQQATQAGGLGS